MQAGDSIPRRAAESPPTICATSHSRSGPQCCAFDVTAMPKLEHEEDPEQVAVIRRVVLLQLGHELLDEFPTEITALVGSGIEQNFAAHGADARIRLQPQTH